MPHHFVTSGTGKETVDPKIIASLRTMNDQEGDGFFEELVDLFLRRLRADVVLLRDALEKSDPTAAAIAHAIKGSAQNFGASRLSTLCEAIEFGLEKETTDVIFRYLVDLEVESQRVRRALENEKQRRVQAA